MGSSDLDIRVDSGGLEWTVCSDCNFSTGNIHGDTAPQVATLLYRQYRRPLGYAGYYGLLKKQKLVSQSVSQSVSSFVRSFVHSFVRSFVR